MAEKKLRVPNRISAECIGARIRELRQERGWTQIDLASQLESGDQTSISAWERGLQKPSANSLLALAVAFSVPVHALFDGLVEEPKGPIESVEKLADAGSIGDRIRKFRLLSQMSQLRLARKIGVSQYCISQWEHGHNEPSIKVLRKVAKALGVSMVDFFVEETC